MYSFIPLADLPGPYGLSINPPDPDGSFERAPHAATRHRQAGGNKSRQARAEAHTQIGSNERSKA